MMLLLLMMMMTAKTTTTQCCSFNTASTAIMITVEIVPLLQMCDDEIYFYILH